STVATSPAAGSVTAIARLPGSVPVSLRARGDLDHLLPGEVLAPEVPIGGRSLVERPAQLQPVDDAAHRSVEHLVGELLDRGLVGLGRAERLDRLTDRARAPDH